MPEVLLPPHFTEDSKAQKAAGKTLIPLTSLHDFLSLLTQGLSRGEGSSWGQRDCFPVEVALASSGSPSPRQGSGLTRLEELSFGLQLLTLCLRWFLGQVVAGELLQKESVGPPCLG